MGRATTGLKPRPTGGATTSLTVPSVQGSNCWANHRCAILTRSSAQLAWVSRVSLRVEARTRAVWQVMESGDSVETMT